MIWRRCPSAVAALVAVLVCGCRPSAPEDPAGEESVRERFSNQARAIALLEGENQRLRREVRRLKDEISRLRDAPGGRGRGESK